jgi:subtilisin family serine protease
VQQHEPEVEEEKRTLHAPVQRLMEALQTNNCLLVAAAGNDSFMRQTGGPQRGAHFEPRHPRWEPRSPARYDAVIGVAATGRNPLSAAAYSNIGDLTVLGNALATLGGDVAPDGVSPLEGVVGVYTAKSFPDGTPNDTGWAQWSGTSFATPIISGIAANLWAVEAASRTSAEGARKKVNDAARANNPGNVQDLQVPPVPVVQEWR